MEPRNPLLELMESVEAIPSLIPHDAVPMSSSARTSPSKSEGNSLGTMKLIVYSKFMHYILIVDSSVITLLISLV